MGQTIHWLCIFLCCTTRIASLDDDDFYPFGVTAGDKELAKCDDSSSGSISLGERGFPFFGRKRQQLWVDTNGIISTDRQITNFQPKMFGSQITEYQLIAPFWADIDITDLGAIYYRSSINESLLKRMSHEIRGYFFDLAQFEATFAFISTWYRVPGYPCGGGGGCSYSYGCDYPNKRNTFQCVLVTDGDSSIALFFYSNITWAWTETGGYPEVGFDAGDKIHYYAVNGSFSEEISSINKRSNVGIPGKWAFRIDAKNVTHAVYPKVIKIEPDKGLAEGGYSVDLTVYDLPNNSISYTYFCRQFHYNKQIDSPANRSGEVLSCIVIGIDFAANYQMRIEAGVKFDNVAWVSDSRKSIHFFNCSEMDCGDTEGRGSCFSGHCNCTLPYIGPYCKDKVPWPFIRQLHVNLTICELVTLQGHNFTVEGIPPFRWRLEESSPSWLLIAQITNYTAQLQWFNPTIKDGIHRFTHIIVENNYGKSSIAINITLLKAYEPTITAVHPTLVLKEEPVSIQGHLKILPQCDLIQLAQQVIIWVIHGSNQMPFDIDSNIYGRFQTQYLPLSSQLGNFSLVSRHQYDLTVKAPEASFFITLMFINPKDNDFTVHTNVTKIVAEIENPNLQPLTGIKLEIVRKEGFLNLKLDNFTFPSQLQPEASAEIVLETQKQSPQTGVNVFNLTFTTNEGCNASMDLRIEVYSEGAQLVIQPDTLTIQARPGDRKSVELTMKNTGDLDAIRPQIPIPDGAAGIFSVSNNIPITITGGMVVPIVLSLNVPMSMPLGTKLNVDLDLSWSDDWHDTKISDTILRSTVHVESELWINLSVTVNDELSYFAKTKPHLEGATVELINTDGQYREQKTTDHDGTAIFKCKEGLYIIQAKAMKHSSGKVGPVFASVHESNFSIFISRQALSYTWGVHKDNITDKYGITLQPHYETHVPIPVVTISPNPLPLREFVKKGLTEFSVFLTNQGLIAAHHVKVIYPDDILGYKLVCNETLLNLPAKSTTIFTVKIVAKESMMKSNAEEKQTGCGSCLGHYGYGYKCGGPVEKIGYQLIDYDCMTCPTGQVHVNGDTWTYDSDNYGNSSSVGGIVPNGGGYCCYSGGSSSGSSSSEGHGIRGHGGSSSSYPPPPVQHNLPCGSSDSGNCADDVIQGLSCVVCAATSQLSPMCQLFECLGGIAHLILTDDDLLGKILSGGKTVLHCAELVGELGLSVMEAKESQYFVPSANRTEITVDTSINWCQLMKLVPWDKILKFPGSGCIGNSLDVFQSCFPSGFCGGSLSEASLLPNSTFEYLYRNTQSMIASMTVHRIFFNGNYWLNSDNATQWIDLILWSTNKSSEDGELISLAEMSSLSNPKFWKTVQEAEQAKQFLLSLQKSMPFLLQGETPTGADGTVDFHSAMVYQNVFEEGVNISKKQGYSDPFVAYSIEVNSLYGAATEKKHGVCAKATMQINQKLTLVREAIEANLTFNNVIDSEVDGIQAHIAFTDEADNIKHNERFSINRTVGGQLKPSLPDGPFSLEPGQWGKINWDAIPYQSAAPTADKIYDIGGNLTYVMENNTVILPLMPIPITVVPVSDLYIYYFHQREVFGDDPFTAVVEPSIPFLLAAFIGNHGYGSAYGMLLTSSQPKIVENKKGLLVDMKIIGAQLNNESITPSFGSLHIGTLKPMSTAVIQYWLTSSLSGNFTELNLTVAHTNLHGDPKLNLVSEASYHELVKDVIIPDTNDTLPSMLCNDKPDLGKRPDTVYRSVNGTNILPVCSFDGSLLSMEDSNRKYKLTTNTTTTLNCSYMHISAKNPQSVQTVEEAKRSDGTIINERNVWLSYSGNVVNVFDLSPLKSQQVFYEIKFTNHSDVCGGNGTTRQKGCETCYCITGETFCTQTWSDPRVCTKQEDCPTDMQCGYFKRTACIKHPCTYREYCVYNQTISEAAVCSRDEVSCTNLGLILNGNVLDEGTSAIDVCSILRIASMQILGHKACLDFSCTLQEQPHRRSNEVMLDMRVAVKPSNESSLNATSVAESLSQVISSDQLGKYLNGTGKKGEALGKGVSLQAVTTSTVKTTISTTMKTTTKTTTAKTTTTKTTTTKAKPTTKITKTKATTKVLPTSASTDVPTTTTPASTTKTLPITAGTSMTTQSSTKSKTKETSASVPLTKPTISTTAKETTKRPVTTTSTTVGETTQTLNDTTKTTPSAPTVSTSPASTSTTSRAISLYVCSKRFVLLAIFLVVFAR